MSEPSPVLEENWDVWNPGEVQSDWPVIGVPIRLAKRAMLKLMGPHDRELLRRQREFNLAAKGEITELRARLTSLHGRISAIDPQYPKVTSHRYGGLPLTLFIPDRMGGGWYDYDWRSVPELDFLKQHRLKPGATVFNLGAHHCVYSLMMAAEVGERGKVVALEANLANVQVAERNKALNKTSWLEVIHGAAAREPGTLFFGGGSNGQVDEMGVFHDSVEVPAITVDALTEKFGAPDLLFVDVEGFECQALEGASQTLRQHRPDLFIEVHRNCGMEAFGGSLERLLTEIPAGYQLFYSNDLDRQLKPFRDVPETVTEELFFLAALSKPAEGRRRS